MAVGSDHSFNRHVLLAEIIDPRSQAQATVGQGGLLGYNIDAQVPMGDFTGTLNYGPQGGTIGVNYAQDGFSASVNAPVPERTSSVKGLLDKFTFGLQYRRTF